MLYTADIPTADDTITATFADDTVIMAIDEISANATNKLQNHISLEKWKIKINEDKSQHVDFSLRQDQCPEIYINNNEIPRAKKTKCLGVHMDSRLTWKEHIITKRKQIDLKIKEIQWLIGRRSKLFLENKILLYKVIIKPILTYGIELWGCASKSNTVMIQRSQSKILRMITNAPWYVSNQTIHDLRIPFVKEVIK